MVAAVTPTRPRAPALRRRKVSLFVIMLAG